MHIFSKSVHLNIYIYYYIFNTGIKETNNIAGIYIKYHL